MEILTADYFVYYNDLNTDLYVYSCILGLSKKLEAIAKKTKGSDIRPWIKSIVNHVYWISSSCGTDGNLKSAKWLSISNHIVNKHTDHSDVYQKCEHGELAQQRQWLTEGKLFKKDKNIQNRLISYGEHHYFQNICKQ